MLEIESLRGRLVHNLYYNSPKFGRWTMGYDPGMTTMYIYNEHIK